MAEVVLAIEVEMAPLVLMEVKAVEMIMIAIPLCSPS